VREERGDATRAEDSDEHITSRAPEDEHQSDPEVQFGVPSLTGSARGAPLVTAPTLSPRR
jgi:hypothetical protein